MVKTSDCGSDIHGFESHYPPHFSKNAPFMGAFLLGTISGFRVRTIIMVDNVLFQDSVSVRLKVLFWHKLAVVKGFGGWK